MVLFGFGMIYWHGNFQFLYRRSLSVYMKSMNNFVSHSNEHQVKCFCVSNSKVYIQFNNWKYGIFLKNIILFLWNNIQKIIIKPRKIHMLAPAGQKTQFFVCFFSFYLSARTTEDVSSGHVFCLLCISKYIFS